MKSIPLLEAADLVAERVRSFEGLRPYVATGDLDDEGNMSPSLVSFAERPSRADLEIRPDDVCMARMKATRKVRRFVEGDERPILSTGFVVLRPRAGLLDPGFLYHWLRTEELQDSKDRLCTGAIQPAITNQALEHLTIPIFSLEEQQRIAAVLDAAEALRAKRRQALARLDTLSQAIFDEMFGSLGLDRKNLEELSEEFRYGTSEKSGDQGLPTLRIPNVTGGDVSYDEIKRVPATESELQRLQLQDGDLLFVRSNGNPDLVGRCAVFRQREAVAAGFDEPIIYASYLIRVRLDRTQALPRFASAYLNGALGRRALRSRAKTSAGQYNLNSAGLGSVRVPVPPVESQREFERRVEAIRTHAMAGKTHLDQLDTLFASLQQRAFRGEL